MLFEQKSELTEQLCDSLQRCAERIGIECADKSVYAFVIFASSGFRNMGLAFSTREDLLEKAAEIATMDAKLVDMLKDHPDLLAKAAAATPPPPLLVAAEWKFAGAYPEAFDGLNVKIATGYDQCYDLGFTGDQINQFFTDFGIDALTTLKSNGMFSGRPFEDDIFLGIQFPDSFAGSISIEASEILNSKQWHSELLRLK